MLGWIHRGASSRAYGQVGLQGRSHNFQCGCWVCSTTPALACAPAFSSNLKTPPPMFCLVKSWVVLLLRSEMGTSQLFGWKPPRYVHMPLIAWFLSFVLEYLSVPLLNRFRRANSYSWYLQDVRLCVMLVDDHWAFGANQECRRTPKFQSRCTRWGTQSKQV